MPSRRARSMAALRRLVVGQPAFGRCRCPPAGVRQPGGPGPFLGPPAVAEHRMVRSAGPACTAAWVSRDRARARAPSRSPTMPTTPASVRSTSTGAAGIRLASSASRDQRSGTGAARSRASGAQGTSPIPAFSARKPSEPARRCHSEVVGSAGRAHHRRGIGDHPVAAGGLARPRLGDLGGEFGQGGGEARVLFLEVAGAAVFLLEPHAHGHHRAQRGEHREAGVAEHHHHGPGQHQRGQHGDVAELAGRRDVLAHRREQGSGSGGVPGRGGRLKGAVAAGVRLCSVPGAGARFSSRAGRTSSTVRPAHDRVAASLISTPSSSDRLPGHQRAVGRAARRSTRTPVVLELQGGSGPRRRFRWPGRDRRAGSGR